MIRYFCYKCGEEIGDFNMNEIFTVRVEPPEVRAWTDEAEAGTYILCRNCVQKLNKWINKKDDFIRYAPQPDLETLSIPDACQSCSNHPLNGGSGICNCTLGTPQVKC